MKVLAASFLLLSIPVHAENLFSNGTLDTAGGWKGDRKIVEEAKPKPADGSAADEKDKGKPNRCLVLTAKKKDTVFFSQEVDTKGAISLTVTFCYKTKNYTGGGLELRGIRPNSAFTYINRQLSADGEWNEMTWVFTQLNGSNKIDFSFILLQGEGEVFFDNLSVEAAPLP